MKKSYKNIVEVAENLDWSVIDIRDCGFTVTDGTQLEFEKYTPAGEDFSFTVSGDSPENMIEEIKSYSANFDTEEHIAGWIEAKRNGVSGVPSIKELVEDADAIENMLRELAEAVTYGVLSKS